MNSVTLYSRLPEIIATSEERGDLAVEAACASITRRAKMHSAVDTGLMRASWEFEMLGDQEGRVFNVVRYAVYNEYGTRYMSPQPMLHPAIAETRDEFAAEIAAIFTW